MPRRAILDWGVSSFYGWGVYGLNLALHLGDDSEIELISSMPLSSKAIYLDALRMRRLEAFRKRSAAFCAGSTTLDAHDVHLNALGGDTTSKLSVEGGQRIGIIFFESELSLDAVSRLQELRMVVAGSAWNRRLLNAYGIDAVETIFQGVDPTLFHPGQKTGLFNDRFLVFSGGKAETRKAQDLVLAAFRRFSAKRRDAMLVTAWRSPWPKLAATLDRSGIVAPVQFASNGQVDVGAWAAASGIDPDRVINLGAVPNVLMPNVLREMDVALFPNRAEGGTNLVAMECMACGVPTILAKNTGHLDLLAEDTGFVLEEQSPTPWGFAGVRSIEGWSDSNIDEIEEALERAYVDRANARRMGLKAAEFMNGYTWAQTSRRLKEVVLSI
jgi:glycosyltransferase involved in cell wall biosynthesis